MLKIFFLCSVVFYLMSCGTKNEPPEPLDPNKKIEDQQRLKTALEREQELKKKAQKADIEGTSTPIANGSNQNPPSPTSTQTSKAQTPTAQSPTAQTPTAQSPTAQTPTAQSPTTQSTTVPLPRPPLVVVAPVCTRTYIIKQAILKKSGKTDCRNVTVEDLQAIVALVLGSTDMFSSYPIITSLKSGDFSGLTSLEILRLEDNRIKTLPPGIFDGLISLKSLDLESNRIKTLPPEIFNRLTSLKHLNLSHNHNRMANFPPNVFSELTTLEWLNLAQGASGCDRPPFLPIYTEMFDNLTSLKTLILGDEFKSLPNGMFKNLGSLNNLFISGCFQTLPSTIFRGLNSLENLGISSRDESLTHLPEEIFSHLLLLKKLRIAYSSLESLPPRIFAGLSLLEELNLWDNKLTLLPEPIFQGLTSLKILTLYSNDIQSFFPNTFKGLLSLEQLTVRANIHLTSFPPGALEGLPSLEMVDTGATKINATERARIKKELQHPSSRVVY